MKKDWQEYLRAGIVHFMAFPGVMKDKELVFESIKKIVDNEFFSAIEITGIKDDAVRKRVKEILKSSGITVVFSGQPQLLINRLNLNHPEKNEREKAVNQVKASVNEAILMEACGVGVVSGPDPGKPERKKGRRLLIDSLKEACAYSKERNGPPIILETFDRNVDKKCLIGPSGEACEVAEEVRKEFPDFGLMIDLSHLPLLEESSDYALKKTAPYLRHVHIGNCVARYPRHPAYGDEHPVFGIPEGENGVPALASFLNVLKEIGYLGKGKKNIVSFEVKPFGNQTPEEVISICKKVFISAWESLA